MNLPEPGVLVALSQKTLVTILVLQQICAICRGATKVEETVTAAKRAQALCQAAVPALVKIG